MPKIAGNLRKMSAQVANPVEYTLTLGSHHILLNAYIGQSFELRFTGNIYCVQCGRKTRKSFQQGHCFPCMQRLMECNLCIIHPEKCHIAHSPCPQGDWAHAHCAQPHIVYLANSSGLKVGITRHTQMPTRWVDQGASQALPIFQVANRYQSGVIEVCLKQFINDKTDWRKLLKKSADSVDLFAARDQLIGQAREKLLVATALFPQQDIEWLVYDTIINLVYPIEIYPQKIVSLSFDKSESIGGNLQGIKGQYLLFDTGVINIRKFSGYEVEFNE